MNKEQVKQQYEEFTNTFAASLTLTRPIVRSTGAMVMMGLLPGPVKPRLFRTGISTLN